MILAAWLDGYAQSGLNPNAVLYLRNDPWQHHLLDRMDIQHRNSSAEGMHPAIQPLEARWLVNNRDSSDSYREAMRSYYDWSVESKKPILKYFYRHPAYLYSVNTERFQMGINPLFNLEVGKEHGIEGLKFVNTRGAEVRGLIGNRIGFYSQITENQAYYPEYIRAIMDGNGRIMPGEGIAKPFKANSVDYLSAHGYVTVRPIPELSIQFGQDKNFWGHGFRSLELSDVGKDYLFLKLDTRVWKLRYTNLFAELVDSDNQFRENYLYRKYLIAHHLSADITPSLNIGLFESVVHGRQNDSTKATMEWYYFNPVIFYRAVEFGLGSPDNVLIGLDWRWNLFHTVQWYGQVVFDEFKFNELVKGTGWWANKFGVQSGLKYVDMFGVKNLDAQFEFNAVRPYMYTHYNTHNNYTAYLQPLAHPYGANFYEWLVILRARPCDNLLLSLHLISTTYGQSGTWTGNVGQDIFVSSDTRRMDYGNKIAQGIKMRNIWSRAQASWMFKSGLYLDGYLLYLQSKEIASGGLDNQVYIGLAFRMNLADVVRAY